MGVSSEPVRISFPMLATMTGLCLIGLIALSSFSSGLMPDQKGFVSVDCGVLERNYTDTSTTSLNWISDSSGFGLTDVSNTSLVETPLFNPPTQFSTIRYFSGNQSKYCYVFNGPEHGVQQKNAYLIRASFWLGGGSVPFPVPSSQQINFKLLINADHWDNISINFPQTDAVVKEMYMVADLPTISVCLAGRAIGLDTPFISSLELRPLNVEMQAVQQMKAMDAGSNALFTEHRINYGSSNDVNVRYPDDIFDRIWAPDTTAPLSTNGTINITIRSQPPNIVMQTARVSDNYFNITFTDFTGMHGYYYTLYFAEISNDVTAPGQRVFDYKVLNASGIMLEDPSLDIYNDTRSLAAEESYSYMDVIVIVEEGSYLTFTFQKSAVSTYGPLICALELQRLSDHEMSLGTNEIDVIALDTIKATSQFFDSWRGDPCLPYAYNWLTCSPDSRPQIITLSLSNKNLGGEIPTSISNLTALVELDLQGNNLNGKIPEFLAELPNLKTLLLQNNNLSGVIPQALLDKVASSGLNLSVARNPYLCTANNNESFCLLHTKAKSHTPLVVGLGTVGAIVVVGVGFFLVCRRRWWNYIRAPTPLDHDARRSSIVSHAQVVERSNLARCFAYQEIEAITNHFATKLGQGGFGPVFFGVLSNGLNVAVKVLSEDSLQGVEQFLNEVSLLSRVHHRNLVALIGYCVDLKLALVYEYMVNGSLHQFLHGKLGKQLAWRDRLKIVVGSAEGLEYLHKGCYPHIIHRDVKSSNILLDDQLEGKLSDFGISRTKYGWKEDVSQSITIVQGSFGYLDPEYAETQKISNKIDVYAFGILLLEIVSGRLPTRQPHLLNSVRPFVERGDLEKIVDARIADNYNVSSMWKVIDVAMMCVEHDSTRRPDMSEVSFELKWALSMELKNEDIAYADNYTHSYGIELSVR